MRKQRVRECTISSDLLLLLQIKPMRCESRWYLRCSDPDARDDLCLNPAVTLLEVCWFHWRTERLLLYLTDRILSSLSPNCINLSLYSSSCDAIFCPSISFVEMLTFTLFLCSRIRYVIKSSPLFGRITWNAGFLWRIFLLKMPGWPVPPLPSFDGLSGA